VTLKNTIILFIYLASIFLVAIALSILFSEEERGIDVEYIVQDEIITPVVFEELNEKGAFSEDTRLTIIYFMNPITCPVCMLEIDEFSALLATEFTEIQYQELFAFNSDNQNPVNLFMHSRRDDKEYIYQLSDVVVDFLSTYGLRSQLVGQVIFIDVNKKNVVSRAILESSEPTRHESKEGFILLLKSLI